MSKPKSSKTEKFGFTLTSSVSITVSNRNGIKFSITAQAYKLYTKNSALQQFHALIFKIFISFNRSCFSFSDFICQFQFIFLFIFQFRFLFIFFGFYFLVLIHFSFYISVKVFTISINEFITLPLVNHSSYSFYCHKH